MCVGGVGGVMLWWLYVVCVCLCVLEDGWCECDRDGLRV